MVAQSPEPGAHDKSVPLWEVAKRSALEGIKYTITSLSKLLIKTTCNRPFSEYEIFSLIVRQ